MVIISPFPFFLISFLLLVRLEFRNYSSTKPYEPLLQMAEEFLAKLYHAHLLISIQFLLGTTWCTKQLTGTIFITLASVI